MKKRLSVFVLSLILCCSMLAGCGATPAPYADSPYLGTWEATDCSYSGMEFAVKDILGGEFEVTLDENGKIAATIIGEEEEGTWEPTENGLKIMDSENEMEFTAEDEKLVMEMDGVKIYFEKKE